MKPSVNEKASANAKTYANAKGSEKAKAYANAKAHANAGSSANTKSSANVKAPGAASSAKERAQAGGLNNAGTNAQAQAGMLTQQQALEIALQHAGVKAQDISRQRIKLDYEHGRQVYEIEFNVGWTEYSYDVDAANGEILSFEMDMDD